MPFNLMYHDVFIQSPDESGLSSDLYKIHLDEFEKQVTRIKDIESVNPGTFTLTFDDGGSSFYTPIADVLERYSLKGYFFIASKYIGTQGFITKEQIKELDKRGHIIGSHSHSHPDNMTSLSKDEIEKEWSLSISILESIVGHKINVASIPNGYQTKTVIEAASKNGVQVLYTSKPSCKDWKCRDVTLKGRYVILRGMKSADIDGIIKHNITRQKLLIKWSLLNVVKSLLGNKYETIKQKIMG